jgi:magnesium chelatase subunit D
VRRGEPRGALRLNVIETLRAAAPWQTLRRQAAGAGVERQAFTRVEVRAEDFHVSHFK